MSDTIRVRLAEDVEIEFRNTMNTFPGCLEQVMCRTDWVNQLAPKSDNESVRVGVVGRVFFDGHVEIDGIEYN